MHEWWIRAWFASYRHESNAWDHEAGEREKEQIYRAALLQLHSTLPQLNHVDRDYVEASSLTVTQSARDHSFGYGTRAIDLSGPTLFCNVLNR